MLVALNTIAQTQSKPTQQTPKLYNHLLNYCATYPNVGLQYHKSNMVLSIDSDASYLVAPYAKSRIVGYYHLSPPPSSFINAPILVECKTLRHVVTSSAECETAGVFPMHKGQFQFIICYKN